MAPPRKPSVDTDVMYQVMDQLGYLRGVTETMDKRLEQVAEGQERLGRENAEQHAETADRLTDVTTRLKALEEARKPPSRPNPFTFLKEHWQVLFGIGTVLAGLLAAMFGVNFKGGEK